uniref:B30.2/SPRY domain-containing protein n=1 Tax=Pygocentrus nattereri TaxID=42514 RepID=A0AAR2LY38_PYGNA
DWQGHIQKRTCPEHGKLLEVFCRTDQRCICHLCITDTHRTHDVISIEVEVAEAHVGSVNFGGSYPWSDVKWFILEILTNFDFFTVVDLQIIVFCFYLCFAQHPNFIGIGVVGTKLYKGGLHEAPESAAPFKYISMLIADASKLTLNLNTANMTLRLSNENRKVTAVPLPEDYPDHPERFDFRAQILCNEGLQGSPQYWEVEYSGGCWVCIAVSYIGIHRKGKWVLFGRNRCSWGLRCGVTSYSFWHNNKSLSVQYNHRCSRIGVYLDHGAGVLAFYNVSDNMSLIHKVQTKFTEPVYAGFGLAGKGTRDVSI